MTGAPSRLRPLIYDHSQGLPVTTKNLKVAQQSKLELMEKCIDVLQELGISYVITNGSLLEILRGGDIIPQDDDIDIRFEDAGMKKLMKYAKNFREEQDPRKHSPSSDTHRCIDDDRGISMDIRVKNIPFKDGIDVQLVYGHKKTTSPQPDAGPPHLNIHLDLVPESVSNSVFEPLVGISDNAVNASYKGLPVKIPEPIYRQKHLLGRYGPNYMKPHKPYKVIDGKYYHDE